MDNEIESLWLSLGIKSDDPSASEAVNNIIKTVQSKLKSSIYGGKDGVITLPATIEGKFKNGREIDKSITDAYAAIYDKAKQMADESVSLTLKDIDDFKAQIDKFGKKTAKYKSSDIISNASNNLRQTLSVYQDYINELRIEVGKLQKVEVKQNQKTKAQQKAKNKKTNYHGITDEEIEANIQSEQKRRLSGLKQVEPRGYKRNTGFDTGVATERTLKETERGGSYPSNYARQMRISELAAVKWMKKSLKTYQSENIADDYAKALQNGKNKNKLTNEQKASEKANLTSNELAKILGGLEARRPDTSLKQFSKYLEATLQFEKGGKGGYDAILLALNKTFNRYFNSTGTLGITDGGKKGVGKGHTQAQQAISGMIKLFKDKLEHGFADKLVKVGDKVVNVTAEEIRQLKVLAKIDPRAAEKEIDRILKGTNVSSTKQGSGNKLEQEVNKIVRETKGTTNAVKAGTRETKTQTAYDKLDNVKKDTDAAKHIKVDEVNRDINKDVARSVKKDEVSGFNTNDKADTVIDLLRQILSAISGEKSNLLALPPAQRMKNVQETAREVFKNAIKSGASYEEAQQKAADMSNKNKQKNTKSNEPITNGPIPPRGITGFVPPPPEPEPYKNKVDKSHIYASPIKTTVWDALTKAFEHLTGATKEYEATMKADAEEQDKMAAERIKTWGMNNGRNPNDTGDIAGMRRILQLYRTNKSSIEQNPELRQRIKLTEGREIDTTKITKALAKALSGKQMRNAQMGGSPLRQILGSMTFFAGMPSIEKSRAQADGLNQVLGNINKALQSVLSDIQRNETTLAGMEKTGQVQFDDQGYITKGSSAAYKTLADLEEHKVVLDSILADMNMVDQVVGQTGGKFTKLVRRLSFTSPVLRENNDILRNINAGLDKGGKALKFQTRMAEILNYTFQLIGRSIGQWFKRLISMLNPFTMVKNTIKTVIGWVKSAFQDFASYDTKWQRTMNVIKINFQRAIKPAMEWIAQKLVNIIGFFNIISMKVQEAFGQTPVDLFDQAGANAEKMRRELEKAANVTAGFDELHDIGSDNSGENDLLGDIYKPQLSDEWKAMAEEIGDLFAGLIKGEKTIGEVFGRIFEMLMELLGKIAKAIWDWFKTTSLGKWLIANWKKILATILALFLGWQLLKIAGPELLKAMFGWITSGKIAGIFSKLGTWMMNGLQALSGKGGILGFVGSFGQGIVMAFQTLFTGGKYSLLGTLKEMFTSSAAITEAGSWGSMIGFAITKALGAALAGAVVAKGFDMVADDASYNMGLKEYGGKDEDKKSGLGGKLLGAAGGAALAGLVVGGPIAMGVGAIVGLLTVSLAPAIEEITKKSKEMNNEMQKIEYYEGAVKGAQTQVDIFDEQLGLLKQSLELSTQAVYNQGEKLGISKTRMDELVKATQDGTFTTDMLTGSETGLAGSLTDLAQKQEHTTEVTKKLEEAQKKLLKAQTELSIAQDVEAGNFELAAARIELAEAQGVYSTEDATKKRIQLYKQGGEEERKNLLQNLTDDQRTLMAQYNGVTEKETKELVKIWQESGEDMKRAFLSGTDESVQREFENNMNSMDNIIKQHQGFWQKAGDTIAEIFSFGNATTWTYNAQAKYEEEQKKGKFQFKSYDVGTNYVPSDGLAYLHQGEAVIPKKYNQPYQPTDYSGMESALNNLTQQVAQINNQVNQGIAVKGQFVQRGNDLVATVEKANNRLKNNVLNNKVYAR